MTQEQNNAIRAVLNTLNLIDVRGRADLDRMLGCMQVLENLIREESGGDAHG